MWWWKQVVHAEVRIAVVAAFFVIGVSLAPVFSIPWFYGVCTVPHTIFALFLKGRYSIGILTILAIVIGVSYGSAHLAYRELYNTFLDSNVTLEGRVKEDPGVTTSGQNSLQLESVRIENNEMSGTVLVTLKKQDQIKRGDIVTFRGLLSEGFGSFAASMRSANIESIKRVTFSDTGRVVRDWFADAVREVIPEPQASLGIGFLTGQKTGLPPDLADAMRIAGLTHIVVASGYNLTILVRLARKLLLKFSKYLSALASTIMIVGFIGITGLSPSMTRAGLVSGLSVASWYYGRAMHPFVLLALVAAVTVAIQPSYVWGDLGWQLSFAAFFGVMIVGPLLQRYFFGKKQPGFIRQILGETIAAHCVTVPIIALSFGTVSNVAVVANLLVVPLVPLAMLLTFICGAWSLIGVPLAWLIATPTTWLLGYMTQVATFVAELDWAQFEVTLPAWVWLAYAGTVCVACAWMWRAEKYNFRGTESLL